MTYPVVLFWLLLAWAAASRGPGIYYLFFASWSFGTLAVAPPELTGGASLTPAWIVAAALSVKIALRVGPGVYLRALTDPGRFGWLALCTAYAAASAFVLPRLFEGQADVIIMKLVTISAPEPLGPSTANITQAGYFVLTTVTTVALYFAAEWEPAREQLLAAFRFGAVVALATGAADFIASQVGLSGLLEPFRNATYVLMTDNKVMDLKRVVGLTPEASTYAALCVSFLALILFTPAAPRAVGGGPAAKWGLVAALAGATYLSTSSGGFVSLAVLGALFVGVLLFNVARLKPQAWMGAVVVGIVGLIGAALFVYHPELFQQPLKMIDAIVLRKATSDSYAERSMWNAVALKAFLDTHTLGAGMGAVRASGWIYAVLGNIGLPGALTLAAFLIQTVLAPSRSADSVSVRLSRAAKLALVPNLMLASLSSTSVGYGLGVAWLAALSAGLAWPRAYSRSSPVAWRWQAAGAPAPVPAALVAVSRGEQGAAGGVRR